MSWNRRSESPPRIECDSAAELVRSYLLGDIDESDTPLLESHLDSCPSCSLLLEGDALRPRPGSPQSVTQQVCPVAREGPPARSHRVGRTFQALSLPLVRPTEKTSSRACRHTQARWR